jgi:coenzyme F420-0:L-glutamate ligase/coenzyme F420-1:gamma-L-glutamate ligase
MTAPTTPEITPAAMLEHLRTRRSVRAFTAAPVGRDALERLVAAAVTAPSASNRQPWRFIVVTGAATRATIATAVRAATEAIDRVVLTGAHAAEWGSYGDFFWQPLASAAAIIVPAVREPPDPLAGFLRSAGADPARFQLPSAMKPERCALGGAVMALQLQAHAEGLGSAWMAGPMVACAELEAACGIAPPWHMVGAIAVGHPAAVPAAPSRKAPDDVITWMEDR